MLKHVKRQSSIRSNLEVFEMLLAKISHFFSGSIMKLVCSRHSNVGLEVQHHPSPGDLDEDLATTKVHVKVSIRRYVRQSIHLE